MSAIGGATESLIDDSRRRRDSAAAGARLHLAMRCHDLASEPVSFALDPGQETVVGRNDASDVIDVSPGRIALPDRWLSSQHFSLRYSPERGWLVRDLKSKNGTSVNGAPVSVHWLTHRDAITAGTNIFLLLTDARECPRGDGNKLPSELVTDNVAFAQQLERVVKIAPTALTVLVRGETGTGKEVLARALHQLSARTGPFVGVNCGAIPESLLEAQLFGAVKGAYTGAEATDGFVRAAGGGTLFLDEIAELHPGSQVAFLRVLEQREVIPVGATQPLPVDIRVIAATHQSIEDLIGTGAFREDLYARLRAFELVLPPLRERPEDIGRLIARLLDGIAAGRPVRIHPSAATLLFVYRWPRNVRELRNALASAAALCENDEIAVGDLPAEISAPSPQTAPSHAAPQQPVLSQPESPQPPASAERQLVADRESFVDVVRQHGGNVSAIARALGTSRSQVRRLLERHGVDAGDYRH